MRGYLKLPEGWTRVSAQGPGPFVTREVFRGPDGTEVQWSSRAHRKRAQGSARSQPVWWRPRTRGWWMAVLFSIGSACFVYGGVASQWRGSSHTGIGITFFVGSLFFTSAAYLQYAEAANVQHDVDPRQATPAMAAGVLGARSDRLAGRGRAARSARCCSTSARSPRSIITSHPSGQRPGVGARRVRIDRIPDRQSAGVRRGLPSLVLPALPVAGVVDRRDQPARLGRVWDLGGGVAGSAVHRACR